MVAVSELEIDEYTLGDVTNAAVNMFDKVPQQNNNRKIVKI